jgi:hypothetical protein
MFFIEFRLFRISVSEFIKMFWSSAAELMRFLIVHWHCGIITMYFLKKSSRNIFFTFSYHYSNQSLK